MPPDLALLSALTGSNFSCLELIFMDPIVFEPLKFDYVFLVRVQCSRLDEVTVIQK